MFNLGRIAKSVTGSVGGIRQVLSANPSLTSFVLPPQVQIGLKVANSLGLKIPDPNTVVSSVVSQALTKARTTLEPSLTAIEATANQLPTIKVLNGKTADEVLNSIDWLIG